MGSRLAIVTATLDTERAESCILSWMTHATHGLTMPVYNVLQTADYEGGWKRMPGEPVWAYVTREILGVVPAFAIGVQKALEDGAEIIACLHDDLLIEEDGWDETVIRLFKACPRAGLCGFGGGKGLGSDDIYKVPYNPMQLARQGFISNMRDAEAHGSRVEAAVPVACLDGFSQIGRREFWEGLVNPLSVIRIPAAYEAQELFSIMQSWGVIHHFYDGMLGCFAKRLGWQTWFLPVQCHHFGGRTAVGDPRYQQWANQYAQATDRLEGIEEEGIGDQVFWQRAHQIGYNQFKDVLPIRT